MSMPYVVSETIWSAKEATETVILKSDFERCQVTIIEITTTGFSGTLDIQGKLHELGSFANVPYVRQDQASIQTPSVSQISLTLNTSTYRYVVLGYWRRLQLVMTRTAGSITCGVAGSSAALALPYLSTTDSNSAAMLTALQIIDNMISGSRGLVTEDNSASIKTAVEIIDNVVSGSEAQVDVVAALPAGANLVGKVGEPVVVETPFTDDDDITAAVERIAPATDFKLLEISLHLNAAPTTGAQNFVVALDSYQGATYDQVLLTIDLVANAVTDLTIKPDRHFQTGDVITCAWTNTDTKIFGLVFKHQLE